MKYNSLVDLLQYRVRTSCDELVFEFTTKNAESCTLTYGELDEQARSIAAHLQQTIGPGNRIALFFPPGLDFIPAFFGCLYAGLIPIPLPLPQLNRRINTWLPVIQDATPALALCTKAHEAELQELFEEHELDLKSLGTDGGFPVQETWNPLDISEETPAFLQYTSGSTGVPKGVLISHGNLLHNLAQIVRCFKIQEGVDRGCIWLPAYHDMGLIGGILTPIFARTFCLLISPKEMVQRPSWWLKLIADYQITISGGPGSAYEICSQRIQPKQLESLNLSSWRVAFVGAETIRAPILEKFSQTFEPARFQGQSFYPCYGLAESTLISAGGISGNVPSIRRFNKVCLSEGQAKLSQDSEDSISMVGCGSSIEGQTIKIVNPDTLRECDEGQVGEIWISGPSVVQHYWEKEKDSRMTLQAELTDFPGKKFLRTGDLGFFYKQELFISGRKKELIVIHGKNFSPPDLEQAIESLIPDSAISGCIAFSIEGQAGEELVVVAEVSRHALRRPDLSELKGQIRQVVASSFQLQTRQVLLVKPFSLPRTSSGKLRRLQTRTDFLDQSIQEI